MKGFRPLLCASRPTTATRPTYTSAKIAVPQALAITRRSVVKRRPAARSLRREQESLQAAQFQGHAGKDREVSVKADAAASAFASGLEAAAERRALLHCRIGPLDHDLLLAYESCGRSFAKSGLPLVRGTGPRLGLAMLRVRAVSSGSASTQI